METLQNQIAEFRKKFKTMASQDKIEIIEKGIAEQELNRGLSGIAKVGDRADDFKFKKINEEIVSLSSLLEKGPVVLTFYRGGWCPYCNLELRSYQDILPKLEAFGATLIALSPEKFERTQATAEKNQLSFPIGTDEGLKVARSFGLVFKLSSDLKELYIKFGHALSETNSEGLWELLIPATLVIGQDQKVSFIYANFDYRERLEPTAILEHLAQRRP